MYGRRGPDLAGAWLAAVRRAGGRGDLASAGARVVAAYADPARGYHDVTHLGEVLAALAVLDPAGELTPAVPLAAFFHDVVYDPRAADNEQRSADTAARVLAGLRVPDGLVAEVQRLVLLTLEHDPDPDDAAGAALSDADLAVLAAPAERYAGYATGVRREYAHVDDDVFAAGRTQVLGRLLSRPSLFRTDHGARHWERPARANVEAELRRLASS